MPWSKEDVDKHKSGLSDEQKSKWVSIANSVLSKDGDEGKAIRVANSQVGKSYDHIIKMWRDDPTFRAMAMTYLGADEEVIKHLIGSHEQKDHDPTKGRGSTRTAVGTKTPRHSRKEHKGTAMGGMAGLLRGGLGAGIGAAIGQRVGGGRQNPELTAGVGALGALGGLIGGTYRGGQFDPGRAGLQAGMRQHNQTAAVANTILDRVNSTDGKVELSDEEKSVIESIGGEYRKDPEHGWGVFAPDPSKPPKNSTSWPETKPPKGAIYAKSEPDFTAVGEFSKVDEDKQQVFGWASIVEKDGTPVVDLQGDFISPGDLEQAAYDYVLDSRVGGEMHQRVGKSAPKEVGTLIESMVITPEKVSKLGLPEGSLPTGWWVGYQVKDPQVWSKVKKGEYAGFSIHGYGKRKAVSKEEVGKSHDVRESLITKALQFADTPKSFAKNLWATAQALEDRGQRDEAMYFGRIAAGVFAASED